MHARASGVEFSSVRASASISPAPERFSAPMLQRKTVRPMPFSVTARAALAPSTVYQATGSASGSAVAGSSQSNASAPGSRARRPRRHLDRLQPGARSPVAGPSRAGWRASSVCRTPRLDEQPHDSRSNMAGGRGDNDLHATLAYHTEQGEGVSRAHILHSGVGVGRPSGQQLADQAARRAPKPTSRRSSHLQSGQDLPARRRTRDRADRDLQSICPGGAGFGTHNSWQPRSRALAAPADSCRRPVPGPASGGVPDRHTRKPLSAGRGGG